MDRITLSVNGKKCSVGPEFAANTSLNEYIRNHLDLRGTKYMCKEGGCGACVVAVTAERHGKKMTFSVNSCLILLRSCQNWEVTTIEGIGSRGKGYHPVQRTLAEYNGTQCGYCSPGFVMNMYSLLEYNHYDVTQYEVENSFGSNTCRCTGSRPILDAFKTFAKDAPKPHPVLDIEELSKCRENCKGCKKRCDVLGDSWCVVDKDGEMKKVKTKDGHVWYRVNEISDIFKVLDEEGSESYMLVNGNTGRGAAPILVYPRVLIDISPIKALKECYTDQNLIVGGGVPLTDLMELFQTISRQDENFSYLIKLYEHLDLVAHIPVRNVGTIGGNLMIKHRELAFSSDVFLLFETIGATIVIVHKTETTEVTLEDFLSLDMTGKVIYQIKIPPLSHRYEFVSFKIMPRSQNAHAQVNAAFLYEFNAKKEGMLDSARIVIGGLSGEFVHAKQTEKYLRGKNVFTNDVLQRALKILEDELIVEELPGDMSPEFRKKLALGLFYKGLLNIIPKSKLNPRYHSGARDIRKTRPLSKGSEVYDTNPIIWPITEPMPKVDALIQCSGEATYVNDLPTQPGEVFCAFVTSDVGTGEIVEIDPSPALKIPGVLAFFSAKDIPGKNSFLSQRVPSQLAPEEIFADKTIKYYDQAIGLIVAETETLANRAALLVHVKYKVDKKPILTIHDARKEDPSRVSLFIILPAKERGLNIKRVLKGSDTIYSQYPFHMENQSCVTRPSEDGLDVWLATQFTDSAHVAISESLNIQQNRINLTVPRCGGAYGAKISRPNHVACASALVTHLMNRPCRFVMSIQANLRVIGKRFPSERDFEVGVSDSGEIQYMEYQIYEDNGHVVSDAVQPILLGALKNCYDNRRWQLKVFNVVTDTASNTFIRAPGSLEGVAMAEYLMERISYELERDPVNVRLNNLDPQYTIVAEIVKTLLQDSEYYKRKEEVENFNKENRWKKRGLRIAMMNWPVPVLLDYHVLLSVYHGDGTVVIMHGGIEIGQGINTKVIQIVAYTLNISMDKVICKPPTVATNPNNFTTGSSKTTEAVCFGAIKCCQILLDRLSVIRETLTDPKWEILIEAAFNKGINLQTSYRVTANDQEPYRSAGAAVAEVELDILTGEHEILRVDIIEDVGTSINPELDVGQVEGSFMMGVGYWTHEELLYDQKTGELLTDRTWFYKVPLTKDIPIDFRIQFRRNSYNPIGVLGSRAVAEPPTCLAICVALALREAMVSSREETGLPRNKWFNVDGPHTLAVNLLKSEAKLEEYLFN